MTTAVELKDELALALARHATSKIASLDDTEAIISLGFRGEALASISSVSRLTLTSRTAEQQEARQAYAEGRDMDVTIKPAAHPVGTTLEVLDLFYNTPPDASLCVPKTEFGHIDEIIRRIATARFDVTINLSHNGKVMRQYRAVAEGGQKSAAWALSAAYRFSSTRWPLSGSMAIWPCAAGWLTPTRAAPPSLRSSIAT